MKVLGSNFKDHIPHTGGEIDGKNGAFQKIGANNYVDCGVCIGVDNEPVGYIKAPEFNAAQKAFYGLNGTSFKPIYEFTGDPELLGCLRRNTAFRSSCIYKCYKVFSLWTYRFARFVYNLNVYLKAWAS